MQRGIYLCVPEQLLELLDRHAFSDCHRCHGSPELVRMNMVDVRGAAQLARKRSTPAIERRLHGAVRPTNSAGLVSLRAAR